MLNMLKTLKMLKNTKNAKINKNKSVRITNKNLKQTFL